MPSHDEKRRQATRTSKVSVCGQLTRRALLARRGRSLRGNRGRWFRSRPATCAGAASAPCQEATPAPSVLEWVGNTRKVTNHGFTSENTESTWRRAEAGCPFHLPSQGRRRHPRYGREVRRQSGHWHRLYVRASRDEPRTIRFRSPTLAGLRLRLRQWSLRLRMEPIGSCHHPQDGQGAAAIS